MIYMSESMPFPRHFTASDLRSMVGEEHCPTGELIVLEKAGDAVTVITTEENASCVGRLSRGLLKGKKVSVKVADEENLRRLFSRICRFFGLDPAR
ncbi:MAG TPA: hypothetical protein PLQ15_02565 [Syntrophales bacterium]|nr:hypothetical protein [Syntrophales bacterium]